MEGQVDLVQRNHYSMLLSFVGHPMLLLKIFKPEEILFLLLFKYSCVHPCPTTLTPPQPSPPSSPDSTLPWFCPCVLYSCSRKPFPPSSHFTLLPPFWLLSDCSLIQCLWLYFACLFVLLISFHL